MKQMYKRRGKMDKRRVFGDERFIKASLCVQPLKKNCFNGES